MKRDPSDVTRRLLLALCRGELDDTTTAVITGLLAQRVAWDALAELASLHGVVGLVRRNLLALNARETVPADAWQRMQNAANQIAFDGVLQLRETDRIATVLNGVNIDPIVLKGHALADLLYGDPLLRPSADIDLLVARSDLARAEQALAAVGYQPISAGKRADQLQRSYHISLVREAMPGLIVLLELHWDLGARDLFRYDLDTWRSRAETFLLADVSARLRRFRPEEQLLHLALHMRKHRYVGLRWLADVAELLRRFGAELDWQYVDATARRAGLQTLLFVTVTQASRYLGAPCPDEWLHRWTPSPVRRRLLGSILTQDALLTPVEMEDAGWTRLAPAEVLLLDKPEAMARELRYRLFPPPETLDGTTAGDSGVGHRMSLYASRLAQRTATLLRR